MSLPKPLTEPHLRNLTGKLKVKDNGLGRCYAALGKLRADAAPKDRLAILMQIEGLAEKLEKDRTVAANRAASEAVEEILAALARELVLATKQVEEQKRAQMKAEAEAEDDRPSEESDDDEESVLDLRSVRNHLGMVARGDGPLPFACGVDEEGAGILVLHRTTKGSALMAQLKSDAGCKKATHGLASAQKGVLVLEVEGPALTGLGKLVTDFLKDYKPMPFAKARLLGEAESADEVVSKVRPDVASQDTAPEPEPASAVERVALKGSVGANGRNAKDDVLAVQKALNARAGAGLGEDGLFGPKTLAAIRAFQKGLGMKVPDGLVSPGGPTEVGLNGGKPVFGGKTGVGAKSGGGAKKKGGGGGSGGGADAPNKEVDEPGVDPTEPDFDRVADEIDQAMSGIGTDEGAVFAVLGRVKGIRGGMDKLRKAYARKFGRDLDAALRDELSGEDLDRAKRLGEDQEGREIDFAGLAQRIHTATEGLGTDEAAVFAALGQVKGVPGGMDKLRSTYTRMFGEDLDAVLRDELSGQDLRRAQNQTEPGDDLTDTPGVDERPETPFFGGAQESVDEPGDDD